MTDLSPQQTQAVDRVTEWFRGNPSEPFRLFGYAGTGKTTIARSIVESLGVAGGLYAAFTGKATHVLRTKGCEPAYTIHSLIYMPRSRAQGQLRRLREALSQAQARQPVTQSIVDDLKLKIRLEEERLSSPTFLLRTPTESRLTPAPLLVVDEVSMVNEPMARDLMRFGRPLLVLGDPAQLPPVQGEGWFIDAEPDHLLTEVHRSALDSPVTRIATAVRASQSPDYRFGVPGTDGDSGRIQEVTRADLDLFDQVLCGTNATRWQAIHTIRRLRGLSRRDPPVHGDRVIVLANNGDADVYNGQQFEVLSSEESGDHFEMVVRGEDGDARELNMWRHGFTGEAGERQARLMGGRGSTVAGTFAQAVTVHKAQGSQWGKVLVIDEAHVFARMAGGDRDNQHRAGRRWLYTAVTRASELIMITNTGVVRT